MISRSKLELANNHHHKPGIVHRISITLINLAALLETLERAETGAAEREMGKRHWRQEGLPGRGQRRANGAQRREICLC